MAKKEAQELAGKRRTYAQGFLSTVKKDFPEISNSISLVTKKFVTGAKGFEIEVPTKSVHSFEEYFSAKKSEDVEAYHRGNGVFVVSFPAELERHKDEKDLIKLCEKERKALLNHLKKEKGLHARRGRNQNGVLRCNLSSNIASSMLMTITILNKNADTFKDVNGIIKKYYQKNSKASLISLNPNKHNYTVEIKFDPVYFRVSNMEPAEPIDREIVPEATAGLGTSPANEGVIIRSLGPEQALFLSKKLRELVTQLAETERDIVLHSWEIFFDAFSKVMTEHDIKFFRTTTGERGIQLSEVFAKELKNLAELTVLSEFELKNK